MESRTQSPRPIPRTQKNTKKGQGQKHKKIRGQGPLEDRPSRGQGQECSRPMTRDTRHKCSPKKKISPQNFPGDLQKEKFFAREDTDFPGKIRLSLEKKRSSQIFCEVSAVFQGKVERRSLPWPIFNGIKKSAILELRTRHF